jgi:hypothetical protein
MTWTREDLTISADSDMTCGNSMETSGESEAVYYSTAIGELCFADSERVVVECQQTVLLGKICDLLAEGDVANKHP